MTAIPALGYLFVVAGLNALGALSLALNVERAQLHKYFKIGDKSSC